MKKINFEVSGVSKEDRATLLEWFEAQCMFIELSENNINFCDVYKHPIVEVMRHIPELYNKFIEIGSNNRCVYCGESLPPHLEKKFREIFTSNGYTVIQYRKFLLLKW